LFRLAEISEDMVMKSGLKYFLCAIAFFAACAPLGLVGFVALALIGF
jgi:hypothetical protein